MAYYRSEFWIYIDCEYFVLEVEHLPYFKKQIDAWN